MVLYRMSSGKNLAEILDYVKKRPKGYDVIQLFDPRAVVSLKQAFFSYGMAKKNFISSTCKADCLSNELLLYMAATPHFNKAVEFAGAKDPKDFFILFENMTGGSVDRVLKDLKMEKKELKFTLDSEYWGFTKEQLKFYSLEELVLEKMALSRL